MVRAERPTSARPGAKAIVLENGAVQGFVGGTCVRPAVRRESLRALADGAPRLLRISPEAPPEGTEAEEGVLAEQMACVSGGALDIHLEPFLPSRKLLLAGSSPVVESLAALGEALGMEVRLEGPVESGGEAGGGRALAEAAAGAFVVVAGHGEGEWAALKAGLGGENARYVGLVASPRRAAAVRERLLGMGLSPAEIARLRSPAGLDLGAESPGEIAVSILAEIIEAERGGKRAGATSARSAAEPVGVVAGAPSSAEAPAREGTPAPEPVGISLAPVPERRDPICGMTVSEDSPHRVTRGGETFFFCCAGCGETFEAAHPA